MTDIVLRNKFTNINNQSNGNTPSEFVKAYTLRKSATELVYPVFNSDINEPVLDTRSENSQVQSLRNNRQKVVSDYLSKEQSDPLYNESLQMEGRSFSLTHISLGKDEINRVTDKIQTSFDEAHTVMLIVASFDTEYLKEMNVLPKDSKVKLDKNPHGLIASETDEVKLRQAVRTGLTRLTQSLGYTEPVAIGSIQLDTDNPHAHIVLCETAEKDKSNAKLFYDGCEWGTLNPQQIDVFTQAVDHNLKLSKELNPYPSDGIRNIVELEQDLVQSHSNAKLYGQLSAISILPEDDVLAEKLRKSIQNAVGLSNKHGKDLTRQVKERTKENPIRVSPYIQLQIVPLANQKHLSQNLQKFSKQKRIRKANNSYLQSKIANQFESSIMTLHTPGLPNENYTLAKLELIQSLYEKAENDPYVYQLPISTESLESYKSEIKDLAPLAETEPENTKIASQITLAQEQLLEVVVNATLDKVLTARDVLSLIGSNFKAIPNPELFKPALDPQDIQKNLNILERQIAQVKPKTVPIEPTTQLPVDLEYESNSDDYYSIENYKNTEPNQAYNIPPEDLPKSIEERKEALANLFDLEAPLKIQNGTISKNDALDIVHNLTKVEKDFGPDF